MDAEGAKTYETINPTDGSVSASLAPPPTLSPSYLPHGLFSHLLPHLASGDSGPEGPLLGRKRVAVIFLSSLQEWPRGEKWQGVRRTLKVWSMLQRMGQS